MAFQYLISGCHVLVVGNVPGGVYRSTERFSRRACDMGGLGYLTLLVKDSPLQLLRKDFCIIS